MFPILETERLLLRELTLNDKEDIFSILSNSKVTRFYGRDTLKNVEEAQESILFFRNKFSEKKGIRWGIVTKETNELIGTIGFDGWLQNQKRAEIGYEISPAHWKRGFASEAIKKVLLYGFTFLELLRIGAVVFPENEPSNILMVKMGFKKEGLLRNYIHQNGTSHDTFVYSIIDTDFFN